MEEEEEFDYENYEDYGMEDNTTITLRAEENGKTIFRTDRFCRELILRDMRANLQRDMFYKFRLRYDNIFRSARCVAPRYRLKKLKVMKNEVTFQSTPEEAFKFLWWSVGMVRGGYRPKKYDLDFDDDYVIESAVLGMETTERYNFMTIARLWLEKSVEDSLALFSSLTTNGLCSAYNAAHPRRLSFFSPASHSMEYRTAQEFATFCSRMPRIGYADKIRSDLDINDIVAQLRAAMPQFRFWASKKYGGVGMRLRTEDQDAEELRTAAFWTFVLLNGDGVLENGFGFPLSDRQKEAARRSFGSRVIRSEVQDHLFMLCPR